MIDTRGQHVLAEYYGCPNFILNDENAIRAMLQEAAVAAGATVVATVFHRFTPHGVSGVVVIEESHLSVHTWPESGYAAVDFYTCGDCEPSRAYEVLRRALQAERSELLTVERGVEPRQSIQVGEHRVDDRPKQAVGDR